jgi:hypothetical protein
MGMKEQGDWRARFLAVVVTAFQPAFGAVDDYLGHMSITVSIFSVFIGAVPAVRT